jgi:hypothetical protein
MALGGLSFGWMFSADQVADLGGRRGGTGQRDGERDERGCAAVAD